MMRRLLIFLAVGTTALCGCAATQGPRLFDIDVPDNVSLIRRADSELVQFRGPNEESWLFIPIKVVSGEGQPFEQAVAEKESEHRAMVSQYPSPRVEKRALPNGGALLTFAYQTNRDLRTYSYVNFAAYWPDGTQIKGTVEGPTTLDPWLERVRDRLITLRLK